MKVRTTRHKNITRVDQPSKNTHGYNVRIQWKGQLYCKFFSDNVCGDRLAALHDAISWRDATEKAIGKPHTSRQVVGLSSRNTTGVIGVRRRKRGNTEVYEATWVTEEGKVGRTTYSIARHGERRAFKLAVRARTKHEEQRQRTPIVDENPKVARSPKKQKIVALEQVVGQLEPVVQMETFSFTTAPLELPDWPELADLLKKQRVVER